MRPKRFIVKFAVIRGGTLRTTGLEETVYLQQVPTATTAKVDVSSLASGLYIFKLLNAGQVVYQQKVSVIH